MKRVKLSRPPVNPQDIRFSDDCFETVGSEVVYYVSRSSLYSGPARFTDRALAEEFARKTKRSVTEETVPVRRRIKWF